MINILFDLDGTLTDPAAGITACILHALTTMGAAAPSAPELRACIGPPLRDTFARLLATSDADAVERAVTLYRERFTDVGLFENTIYEGIPEILAALRELPARLFVATSKPQVFAERVIAHFGLDASIERTYGAALDASLDDKRVLVRGLMEREKLSAERTWMVGDRRHDIDAARANGVAAVGVLYGYGTLDELHAAGADAILETPAEIQRYFANDIVGTPRSTIALAPHPGR